MAASFFLPALTSCGKVQKSIIGSMTSLDIPQDGKRIRLTTLSNCAG
jgi:hypothetical protein